MTKLTIRKNVLVLAGVAALVALSVMERPHEGVLTFLMAVLVKPSDG